MKVKFFSNSKNIPHIIIRVEKFYIDMKKTNCKKNILCKLKMDEFFMDEFKNTISLKF